MVLLVVGLFVAAVPARYDQIVTLSNLPEDIDSTSLRTNLAEADLSIHFYATYHLVMEICFAAVCLTLAAVIFRRRSDERMALFVALLLVLLGTTFWGTTDALSLYHPAGSWVSESLDAVGKVSLFLFFYLFPDGRFVPRWTRYLALAMIAGVISGIFFPGTPLAVSSWPVPLLLLFMLGWLLTGVFAQIYRYRRVSGPVQRQQTKWVFFGFTVALVGFLGVIFFGEVLFSLAEPGTRGELVGMTVMTLCMLLIPLSIGAAILRHRLFDIDVVINRTLVYGALTACIVGIYVLVVGYLGSLLRTDGNLAISLVATGVVAVLFAPLRERLQHGVNRLMYGERDDPYAAVSRLGERLEATLAPEAVLTRIVETVREALKLPYAAIALPRDGDDFEVAAASGEEPPADPLVLPLSYGGESVGRLLLAPRAPGEGFSSADRSLLDSLARHAGVAVHGVRVMADLRRSRERLVLAREEERRRLRRDLHDELAPTLAALGLSAATVSELIPVDPERAASANEKLRATIRATVGDVRRLVDDLRPPALDELGLIEAVRERASHYSAHEVGFRVKVEAPDELPLLPAAVEVAAYRIVQEALTNVSRHAKAHSCTVRLACPNGRALEVEVTDDGVGLPDTPEGGVGLSSMRERAVELGGTCEIMLASPSGTRVFARLPLGEPPLEGRKE